MKQWREGQLGESVNYFSDIFTGVLDLDHAKDVALSSEGDMTTALRWEVETKFTIDTLLRFTKPTHVLDYGCGAGRLSKALIEQNCAVVGADMSPRMRELAHDYVNSFRFRACSTEELRKNYVVKFDCAVAAWVLQHCPLPEMDLELIAEKTKPGGYFLVLNDFKQKIPVEFVSDGKLCWADNGLDIRALTLKHFDLVEQGMFTLPELQPLKERSYWAVYRRK